MKPGDVPRCHCIMGGAVPRFILRYQGADAIPPDAVAQVQRIKGATIVDQAPRMLLIDGDEGAVRRAVQHLPQWSCIPERTVPLPDPRPKIRVRK